MELVYVHICIYLCVVLHTHVHGEKGKTNIDMYTQSSQLFSVEKTDCPKVGFEPMTLHSRQVVDQLAESNPGIQTRQLT